MKCDHKYVEKEDGRWWCCNCAEEAPKEKQTAFGLGELYGKESKKKRRGINETVIDKKDPKDAEGKVVGSQYKKLGFTDGFTKRMGRTDKIIVDRLDILDDRIRGIDIQEGTADVVDQKVKEYMKKRKKINSLKHKKTEIIIDILYFIICKKYSDKKSITLDKITNESTTEKYEKILKEVQREFPELKLKPSDSSKGLNSILNLIPFTDKKPIVRIKLERVTSRLIEKIKKEPDFNGRKPEGILAACLYYELTKIKNKVEKTTQNQICEYCGVKRSVINKNLREFRKKKLLD